jgi:UDP-3-O-[3-hydroxymyristoyl] glucosamine N-acyltransferase
MRDSYSLKDIALFLDAELWGDGCAQITGLATLKSAKAGDLAFLSNSKYASQLQHCHAEAVILEADQAQQFAGNRLVVDNAYLSYAKISSWFDSAPEPSQTIHPSATIDPTASLGEAVSVGANVVIEAGVQIGSGSTIKANSVIGARSLLGEDCSIQSNVSIYHDVRIGHRVVVHSGSVIGADGFGFAPDPQGGWHKISQVGGVVIGDDVEIGACSTIDRGAIDDTIIGNAVIIDNHVQIAHNAVVGDNSAMAAYAAVAGSATLGKNSVLAGGAHVVGHVTLCDNVQLMAHTLVTKDISQSGSYASSVTPLMTTPQWRKNSVRFGQLNDMALRLKKIENTEKN